MSTTQPSDGTAIEVSGSFTRPSVRNAPHTFDPENTRQCPQGFSNKWVAVPDER